MMTRSGGKVSIVGGCDQAGHDHWWRDFAFRPITSSQRSGMSLSVKARSSEINRLPRGVHRTRMSETRTLRGSTAVRRERTAPRSPYPSLKRTEAVRLPESTG
jgi:hypothetical protein